MSDYSRLLEILAKLVSFNTITHDHQGTKACLDHIEESPEGYDLHINRYVSNGFESLVISTQGTKRPKILLQAHLDVVPAYAEQFQLQQHGGN